MKFVGNSRFQSALLITALLGWTLVSVSAQHPSQKTFDSPAKAADALFVAVTARDTDAVLGIFGPDMKEILSSGDPVADRNDRERFLEEYGEMHRLVVEPDNTVALYLGAENWPFPIPLVEKNGVWFFDTAKGKEEILFRRIGRNEHATIDTMKSLVDAQKEYAAKPHDGGQSKQYAQQFLSDEGKQNGLYWKTDEDQPQSPIGPLIADATRQGYRKTSGDPIPFHGYIYRMLQGQGKNAPGGAMSYVQNGKMVRGFAFVAYPAEYRNSGVMTFIVGSDGRVYQKNLGPDTARIASGMAAFDPDKTWQKVE